MDPPMQCDSLNCTKIMKTQFNNDTESYHFSFFTQFLNFKSLKAFEKEKEIRNCDLCDTSVAL